MMYLPKKIGDIVNGVIFFFDEGDEELASLLMDIILESYESPTSIVLGDRTISRNEAVGLLCPISEDSLKNKTLIVGLTNEDDPKLISDYLDALVIEYPHYLDLVNKLRFELLPNTFQLN